MRLIDADALLVKQASIAKMFARSDAQKSLMGRVMYNTERAPTIDAIPVEWMEKMLEKMNHAAEPYFAFFYVLNEWQNTKSIEEQQAESEMRDCQKEQEKNGE